MTRIAQNFVLLLIGTAVLKTAADGTYLRYVKPALGPFLLASGTILVLLALVALGRDLRRTRADPGHDPEPGHDHPGRPHWLLLAPIAALLIVVPPALGAGSVQSGSTAQASVGKPGNTVDGKYDFPPLPAGPAPTVGMFDLIDRASYDSSGELDRRDVTVIGFIVRTAADGAPRTDGTRTGVDLARLVITCCVADAQTMRIHLAGTFPPPTDDTWVTVRGRIQPDSAVPNTQMTPTLVVTDLHTMPTPARVYG
ncbi:TIGR03943 family putative permease subunit [Nocardia sp. alder85J]|uniref:TIGR03943 family putative permease subunit n=1 Tax=Nocardia sp. alder85J TaxID=2862949 RepID=UPI001CD477EB|nr:TIGR03943 family protein [Nocardia sp. alder85J]MCX4092796.1 TIGR03943 family protein [Nocardia sp. alder85J]